MKILVTAGGTREPIDGVRVIANNSTGKTGARLADAFYRSGWETTLLRAESAARPSTPVEEDTFVTVDDLDQACQRLLASACFDLVVHAAAVSDFVVEAIVVEGQRFPAPFQGKLGSAQALGLELVPGKKILPQLKSYSRNPGLRLVGFKLTEGASQSEVQAAVAKVLAAGADLVVHNDLHTITTLRATLWSSQGPQEEARDEEALTAALMRYARSLC